MPFTLPPGSAVDFTVATPDFPRPSDALNFKLSAEYIAPLGDSILFYFPGTADWVHPTATAVDFTVVVGATSWFGSGAATLHITAAGSGIHNPPTFVGHGAPQVLLALFASGGGAHGVAGHGGATLGISAAGSGTVLRYELVGEVRLAGQLVDRTVRAYRRDTGALVGEAETTSGRFRIPTGFSPAEHFIIPLNLDSAADDFTPPCVNRVLSVLAGAA